MKSEAEIRENIKLIEDAMESCVAAKEYGAYVILESCKRKLEWVLE